ncbi:uncharacterized protein EV154DRAFT_606845 [Mucor mucedo]|uniref:uncharacterized protein n=1 Tax=Mucor mucedo TaxID=29922 RepID=UPI00221F50CF|nr:uncharacterized protein EV154DRAFT_606845 [Mucor mucedo]KAI7875444.1 hypothetical protein EV154DRAFT_606845 [Mucor mucedo]
MGKIGRDRHGYGEKLEKLAVSVTDMVNLKSASVTVTVHPRFVTGVVWLDTQGLNARSWRKPNASRVVVVDIPPNPKDLPSPIVLSFHAQVLSDSDTDISDVSTSPKFEPSGSAPSKFATTVAIVSMEVDNHMNTTTPASSTAGPMVEVTSGAIKVPGAKRSVLGKHSVPKSGIKGPLPKLVVRTPPV